MTYSAPSSQKDPAQDVMLGATCALCGSERLEFFAAYRATTPDLSVKVKVTCKDCTAVMMHPMPSAAKWDAYNASYFENAHGTAANAVRAQAFRKGLGKIRTQFVWNALGSDAVDVATVLEIGPGHGEFAQSWQSLIPNTTYYALESDTSLHSALTKNDVVLLDAPDELTGSVDLLVLSHVVEHTLDPRAFLSSMLQTLRPGGTVFIEVPCSDHLYKSIDEPHTFFFTRGSMLSLMTALGLHDISVTWHGKSHSELNREAAQEKRLLYRLMRRLFGHFVSVPSTAPPDLTRAEWQVLSSFSPLTQSNEPARWLRAIAKRTE